MALLCDKTAHFRVAFYCPQHKVHLCNDHAVYLSGGWIILAKEKCSLTGMYTNLCTNFERNKLFVQLMKHGTDTLHVAFILLFSKFAAIADYPLINFQCEMSYLMFFNIYIYIFFNLWRIKLLCLYTVLLSLLRKVWNVCKHRFLCFNKSTAN